MKCAVIIPNPTHPRAQKIVSELGEWLETRGKRVVLDKETAALVPHGVSVTRSNLPEKCDFLIVIGGDGALLSAAQVVGTSGKPILGVNLGSLGFMTAITLEELYPVLERLLSYDFDYDERQMTVPPPLRAIVIPPIGPHTLTNRPIVIPDNMVVRAKLRSRETEVFLTLDGQVGLGIRGEDLIEVKKADAPLRFFRSPFKDYFALLRAKLKWGERGLAPHDVNVTLRHKS